MQGKAPLWLPCLLMILAAVSCAPATQIEKSWRDPGVSIQDGSYGKVLVIGLMKDETSRRIVEDQLVARLRGKGVASYNYSSDDDFKENNIEALNQKLVRDGFDGAIVMRLVDVDKKNSYVPGTTSFQPYYYRFGPYLYRAWSSYSTPGYYTQDKIYYVETNIYSIEKNKLIWSGITSTLNPSRTDKMFNDIDDVISAQMRKEGFLR
jgi:hypothetical protein